jgi:hypothetical protein
MLIAGTAAATIGLGCWILIPKYEQHLTRAAFERKLHAAGQALGRVKAPEGFTACNPSIAKDGAICWKTDAAAIDATVSLRSALTDAGATIGIARCASRPSGLVGCALAGRLDGLVVAVAVHSDGSGSGPTVHVHGASLIGGIGPLSESVVDPTANGTPLSLPGPSK